MRTFVQCSLGLVSLVAVLSGRVLAQPVEEPEEVIVRGKTPSQFRLEIEQARDEMIKLFNEANEGEDNDVRCRYEAPTGSRIPARVCFSAAQDRTSANAARDFLTALVLGFGSAAQGSATGMGGAQEAVGAENRALVRFEDEWRRVQGENQEFAAAVVKYGELEKNFDITRGITSAYTRKPRQIVLGQAGPLCEASTLTEYQQSNNVARVSGTVGISACPAGTTGSFTVVARVRDESGATTPIEFSETWQRADAQDHVFSSNYPIGDNVFLESVRVRNLTCTCAGPTQ
jgi:hypothetical protein